ncbi:lon protease homolog 2, peroxisomal [Exaiptasia diaphana]|uniref:Lon protease homolog n=1 Tax=Exaiptasia diaphana TaxID=2652724 RepID=A0A913XZ19_EXADI|nr:lon protease homolog 2, peroxisomal [Exaiptasia diaphana]KXJ23831.1 Lon protease-like 2, peroxisomal [Exaiptasia diaphana]
MSLPSSLPLLILEDKVLLPGSSMRIAVRDSASIRMIDSRLLKRDLLRSVLVGVVPRRSNQEHTSDSLVNAMGTAAVVVQVTGTNWPKPLYTLLVTGLCRFQIDGIIQDLPFVVANIKQMDSPSKQEMDIKKNAELTSLAVEFRLLAEDLVDILDGKAPVINRLKEMLTALPDHSLPDTLASIVKATFDEKLEVLNTTDLVDRFKKALHLLKRQQEIVKVNGPSKINEPSRKSRQLSKKFGGSSFPIRITKGAESTDDNEDEDDIEELERKLKGAALPEHALKVAMKEIKRLKKMPPQFPEHATTRNYLEWMIDLPWSKETKDNLDIAKARHDLDQDHYGLEKLKKRVIEYLAVRKLKNSLKGPILCFVGPPGVGKTSVGRSIANTLGREFHRISLGGIHDQSDIRGHRRTYVGSMPGRILTALKTVGVKNPVILLDEIDKLSKSLHGDPAAALLEVLDPEQNWTFVDHYLNLPFDLSQVLFIATANTVSSIPPALLDRMELIQVPGYTHEEKLVIATGHLIPKQLTSHGLEGKDVAFSQDAIKTIISSYTREAGVRSLERNLGALCRSVAVQFAEKSPLKTEGIKLKQADKQEDNGKPTSKTQKPFVITKEFVVDVLGPPVFQSEVAQRLAVPGVATGLAWTAMGGEIMFVEATRMGGEGQLTLTGQLGDVMKESAQLALSWLRSHAVEYNLARDHEVDLVGQTDIHVHFPAGAVGKDGPSAGLAIVLALVSLFSGRCMRSDTAMTGEITLRGLVLPVGGIKEKILSAHRAGITRVILPKRNEKDLRDIPENVKARLEVVLVNRVEEAIQAAFEDGSPFVRLSNTIGSSKL